MRTAEDETFLSVDEVAKKLSIGRSVAYRLIDRGRNGEEGGWPPSTWVVITPGSKREMVRVRWERLLAHLEQGSKPVELPMVLGNGRRR